MNTDTTPTTSALEELVRRCVAFQQATVERILSAQRAPDRWVPSTRRGASRSPEVTLFGEGAGILTRLPELERVARSSVVNLQPTYGFDASLRMQELDRRTVRRRVSGQLVTGRNQPLSIIASLAPAALVGPVHVRGLAVDERLVLVAGPPTALAQSTAWLLTAADLVAEFLGLCELTRALSVPILEVPGVTRLSERQVHVTAALCRGEKDATIARRLGVSLRSITSDVAAVIEAVGASSRWEAALLIGAMRPPGSGLGLSPT